MFWLVCSLIICVGAITAERNGNIATIEDISSSSEQNARIVNGIDAQQGQFPWQVSVIFYTTKSPSYCGGSLIHESWVLTAAHCAQGATKFTLKFGGLTLNSIEMGRVDVTATKYFVHPGYNAKNLNNDLALIQLDKPVKGSNRISTVRLPNPGEKIGSSVKVEVSGWGRTSDGSPVSNKLKYVQLTTISNQECSKTYGSDVIKSSTLCCSAANIKSTCNGDSGGPLVQRTSSGAVQVGIVSFVHPNGCASGNPSGYIRTESYLKWIYQITGVVGSKEAGVNSASTSKTKSMKKDSMKMKHSMHNMHNSGHNEDTDDDDEDDESHGHH